MPSRRPPGILRCTVTPVRRDLRAGCGGVRGARRRAATLGSLRAGFGLGSCLILGACGGDPGSAESGAPTSISGSGEPSGSAQATRSFEPFVSQAPPSVEASPQLYVVMPGDTLVGIARMFDLTVEQLLAANPRITDPDRIEAGDELLIAAIPPEDLPLPGAAEATDPARDLSDPEGVATPGTRYTDIRGLRASTEETDLVLELTLGGRPPAVDPRDESLRYSLFLDSSGEGLAVDHTVILENSGEGFALLGHLTAGVGEDNAGGGSPLPAEALAVIGEKVTARIPLAELGSPTRIAVIALAERRFVADPTDPDAAQESLDRLPDGEWLPTAGGTLPSPTRWVRITAGP